MLGSQAFQRRGQEMCCGTAESGDSQRAGEGSGGRAPGFGAENVELAQDQPGVHECAGTSRSGAGAGSAAVEEDGADLAFAGPDCVRDRGLSQAQLGGSGGEAASALHREQQAQLARREVDGIHATSLAVTMSRIHGLARSIDPEVCPSGFDALKLLVRAN